MSCLFNVGLFCLINKDSDTFQRCNQNLKGQGSEPEKKGTIYTKLHIFYFFFSKKCLTFVVRNTFLVNFQSSFLAFSRSYIFTKQLFYRLNLDGCFFLHNEAISFVIAIWLERKVSAHATKSQTQVAYLLIFV